MKKILSLAVACASVVALTPSLQAKPDKDKGGGKGGQVRVESRGGSGAKAQGRVQARPGGNIARVQPNRPSIQTQRFSAPRVQHTSPSVALTGRSQTGLTYNQRLQQLRAQQQRENWRENMEDRRDRWEDRRDDWKDRHNDWKDGHDWHVPFDVHRHWDHDRVHVWNDHRYRWYNNAWVIIDPGFGYGYDYGYYGSPGVYYDSGYSGGSLAAQVQYELAREGYDPGPADGVIGPQTRDAIADYQRDHNLPVTGRIDTALVRELGLN